MKELGLFIMSIVGIYLLLIFGAWCVKELRNTDHPTIVLFMMALGAGMYLLG